MRFVLVVVAFALALLAPRRANAHAAPHAIVLLDLRPDDVAVELQLPKPELDAIGHPSAVDLVERDFHVSAADGAPWTLAISGMTSDEAVVVVHATAAPPAGHSARAFAITNDVLGRDIPNHASWIGIRSDVAAGKRGGDPDFVGETHAFQHTVSIDRAGASGFGALLRMGMQHIADGTDHLLFLFVLLLSARNVRSVLCIVTAFTLGHSLTLLCGGFVRVPTAPVETLIALSIVATAVHAVRPIFRGRETLVAAAFGLVHGLAFARALQDMHLQGAHLALALLGFNLGIEAMQLVIVATTLPWLLLIADTALGRPFRMLGASIAAVVAVGWAGERALDFANPFGPSVARIAAHPVALLCGLAALAVVARMRPFEPARNMNMETER